MANEISASAALSANKGGAAVSNSTSRVATMTGDQLILNVQYVSTIAEALNVGDVDNSEAGYVLIKNLDATNYVELALDAPCTAQVFAKLQPGDFALFPAKTVTMYAKANDVALNLMVQAIER